MMRRENRWYYSGQAGVSLDRFTTVQPQRFVLVLSAAAHAVRDATFARNSELN